MQSRAVEQLDVLGPEEWKMSSNKPNLMYDPNPHLQCEVVFLSPPPYRGSTYICLIQTIILTNGSQTGLKEQNHLQEQLSVW